MKGSGIFATPLNQLRRRGAPALDAVRLPPSSSAARADSKLPLAALLCPC
jgi:hypothetical protein